jgi:transposase-like protein
MRRMKDKARGHRPRRSFTDEFRAGAVRLVLDEGKSLEAELQRARPWLGTLIRTLAARFRELERQRSA